MSKHSKLESDYIGQAWTTQFLWEEGIKLSDIHCWLYVVCGQKAPACGTVFTWVWSFNRKLHRQRYMSGMTSPLMNGSMKAYRSSHRDGSHV
jgi:hypothetical protein